MGQPNVVSTAQMLCSFGMAPSALNVLPMNRVMVENKPAATGENCVDPGDRRE